MNVILKNKSIQHLSIYFMTSIFGKMIPFLLLPLITKKLMPAEYGKWSIFSSVLVFSIPFTSLLLRNQITRTYYTVYKEKLAKIIYNIILINAVFTLILFLATALFAFYGNQFVTAHALYYIPLLAFLTCLKEYFLTLLRYEKRPFIYGIYEISSTLILYAMAILLILGLQYQWKALLIGSIASHIFVSFVACFYMIKKSYIKADFSLPYIKDSLKIGLPLLPHAIGGAVIGMSDRIILERMLSVEIVGIYAIGYSLGMTAQIVVDAFNKTWGPWLYEQLAQITHEKKRRIIRLTYLYYLMLPLLFTGVCIVGHFYILYFIDPQYHQALPVLYWAAGAAVIKGFYVAIFPYMTHLGKTIIYPIATGIAGIANIVLTIYLIEINGMIGAAQATAAAFLLMFLMLFIYTQKKYPMPWLNFKKA
ncbi:MAG: lipopolysaccharide biosynthesis protein [Alphaproteobacteria bacterium]